ncbi:25970_t:CDS:1 [Gigaspora margarita]|uniref:25970_t:CDS:1 n=1 Tax=Gigaspora margarita TaxID=4874 RepID=A0ABN7V6N3_GIGMA|nr:25970_t:CDS:1 [Gigaspora margarita]
MYNYRFRSDYAKNQAYTCDDIPNLQSNIIEMDSVEQTNANIKMPTLINESISFSKDVEINVSSEDIGLEKSSENISSKNIFSKNISSENISSEKNMELEEYLDELDNELMDVSDYNDYLQEWMDMLEEERQRFDDNDFGEEYEDEDKLLINDTHPAVDVNAKWELVTLFKKLELSKIL